MQKNECAEEKVLSTVWTQIGLGRQLVLEIVHVLWRRGLVWGITLEEEAVLARDGHCP
jgi:hypothetical protein